MKIKIIIFTSILTLSVYLLCFYNSSVNQVDSLLDSFITRNRVYNKPHLGALAKWSIRLDTYTHDCNKFEIKRLYQKTVTKLKDLYKLKEEVTFYTWEDDMTYPREALVVQFKHKEYPTYLITRYSINNDNDSYSFEHIDGIFVIEESKPSESYKTVVKLKKKIEQED
jgi:hypothetical protein